ncbi:hypothetical protein EV701_1043 [Chthoniobacter flavus]|uniref:hypothetical protein n=1 Tax=Chthoniobacter flavus TaxID=191863 RepID=UPI00104712EF|nr:hypothetical protein [Chthoniobacter flavus]TCO93301.1 hypothetical protein EV701_1043 [Chthoniobacter flavus]
MKPLQIVACALALVFAATVQAADATPSPEIQQLLKEGQEAYQKGDIEGAKSAFEMVYTLDSRNITAINYLTRIRAMKGAAPKGGVPIERQVASVMIPQIQFRDATLGSALDYLKKAVARESGNKVAVNFVVKLPAEQVATQTVTLSLSKVPFTEAVKYLASVANLDVEYQKYAIVLKPKADGTASATTTTGAPAATTPTGTNALPGAQ